MPRKVIFYFIFCLLVVSTTQAAQIDKTTTLDSLIQVALKRNPDLHVDQYRYQSAEYQAKAAGRLPDPQLSLGVLNLPHSSFSMDETPMSGVSLGLTQTIPWPGKLSAENDIAHLHSKNKALILAGRKNSVIRQVTVAYFDYSYWSLVGDILKSNKKLLQQIIDVSETNYANGLDSFKDVLRSQTSLSRLKNRLLIVNQKRTSALVQLAWLTDNPGTIDTSLSPMQLQNPPGKTYTASIITNPLLDRTSLKKTITKRQLDLARTNYWPDFTLGVDYRFRKDVPMNPVRGEDFLTFKIGIKMPLWGFARQKNQTESARQMLQAAQVEEHSITSEIESRVKDIRLYLLSITERLRQYNESILPLAQAARDAAQVAYEVSQIDFDSFLNAQLDMMDIELEKLELLKQYHQQTAILHELTGKPNEVKK